MKSNLRLPLLIGLLACASLPSLQAKPLPQTLTLFAPISTQAFPEFSFEVDRPIASSGLPVTVTVKSGPAILRPIGTHYKLTPTGTGIVTLIATQTGNNVYEPARAVETQFDVKMAQKIEFPQPKDVVLPSSILYTFNSGVRSSSGLSVELSVPSLNAVVTGRTVVVDTPRTITVVLVAKQEGNDLYAPALPVTRSFTVKVWGGGPGGG